MSTRTRNSYIPEGIATRGLSGINPAGGSDRATRGLIGEYPGAEAPPPPLTDPVALLSTITLDSNGIRRLLSADNISLAYCDITQTVFKHPDREYNGYGADGYRYTDGVKDLTDRASWSVEADGGVTENRGPASGFPDRVLVVATRLEVVLLDADTLDVWMRFVIQTTPPVGVKGVFAGQDSTVIHDVSLVDGFLFVATNEGLRIADFAGDRGYCIGVTGSQFASDPDPAVGGLRYRNTDTYLDAVTESDADKSMLADDCLCIEAVPYSMGKDFAGQSIRGSMIVAVVGHAYGLTAVSLRIPSISGHRTIKHSNLRTFSAGWEVEDDEDGDTSTPYFVDDNFGSTNWQALSVRPGDVLMTDLPSTHVITRVEQLANGRRLWVSPEFSITDSGSEYTINREVAAVHLDSDLTLAVADGPNAVGSNAALDWFEAVEIVAKSQLYGASNLTWRGDRSLTAAASDWANTLRKRGTVYYLGTNIGVFRVSEQDLEDGRLAKFVYSTPYVTTAEAEFQILHNVDEDTEVIDIAVDPETGNLAIAVTGENGAAVTEINPDVERAFRYFDNVGRIRTLLGFRNPNGPPDVEVS